MATPIKQIKDSADVLHDIQGIEYIVGTQTASTNMWKGVSDSEELYAGKVISYKLPYAGSTNTNTHTGASVRGTAVTVATGELTTRTASVGTAVGANGTTTALTGVKVTGTTTVVSSVSLN